MALSDPRDDQELPHQLGDWRRGDVIGEGGAGRVYLAEHVESGIKGALKIAHASLRSVQRHWFRREAALAARLRHASIVPLLDSGDHGGRPFLVYEHVPGPTLGSVADELSLKAIVSVGSTLFDGLTYAHDAGVVHCDITPSNIILAGEAPHRVPRLIDFGLAKARNERSHTRVMTTVSGTPGYLSPEQARGSTLLGPASDLFGCGAVLFRLLSGYAPYADVTTSSTLSLQPPMPFGDRHGQMESSPLARVVLKLLAEDPEMRYPSAAVAGRAWRQAAADTPLTQHAPAVRQTRTPLVTVHTDLASTAFGGDDDIPAERVALPEPKLAPLIGREAIIARLVEELQHQAAQTSRSYVVLHGPPGEGRTRVAEEVIKALGEWRVVRVEGRRHSIGVPREAGAKNQVVGPPMECLAAIATNLAGAPHNESVWRSAERLHKAIGALDLRDASSGEDALIGGLLGVGPSREARTAVMGALEVVKHLVGAQRTLIVVDDADGVDETSWQVINALLEEPGIPVAVLQVRDAPLDGAVNQQLPWLSRDERVEVWRSIGGQGPTPEGTLTDLCAYAVVGEDFQALSPAHTEVLSAIAAFGTDLPLRAPSEIDTKFEVQPLLRSGLVHHAKWSCARWERWIRIPSPKLHAWATQKADRQPSALRWLSRCCRDAPASNLPRVAELAQGLGLHATAAHAWAEAGLLAQRAQRASVAVQNWSVRWHSRTPRAALTGHVCWRSWPLHTETKATRRRKIDVRAWVFRPWIPCETSLSIARIHILRGQQEQAREAIEDARARADQGDAEHVARVAAMIELADGRPGQAIALTEPWLSAETYDPYERATTQLTHAAALERLGRDAEAQQLRTVADGVLEQLGANVALEHRRWSA